MGKKLRRRVKNTIDNSKDKVSNKKVEKTSENEINLDFKQILKYGSWLLILIPIFLSIFFRMTPAYLPITDDWAADSVENSLKSQITQQINGQYPNLPQTNKQDLVNQEYESYVKANKGQIEQQIEQTSQYFKTQMQDEDGQTYLLAIDPWLWAGYTRNYIENGYFGNEIKNGKSWYNLRNGREGKEATFNFLPFFESIVYKILKIFKNLNYPFIKTIIQIFSPSLVFCCWKKNNPNSLERWIKEETGYENILRMSRQEKNLFMLLNSKGEIEKAVYIKRYGHEIPNKIKFFERKFPNIKNPNERIWKVDWLKGRPINPKNKHEIIATIDELIEFQKKTKLEKMDKNDVFEEIMFIKKGLEYYGYNDIKYFEWLEQYEKFIDQNQISMTPVHGDFWFSNVVYDPETKKIILKELELLDKRGLVIGLEHLLHVIENR